MLSWWQDLRFGWRCLLRQPGFSAVAALVLAAGIGANAAIFAVVSALAVRPLPFQDSNRLVMAWETNRNEGWNRVPPSPVNFLDWREESRSFEELAAARFWFYALSGIGGQPERVHGMRVSANFFRTLGVDAARGRSFAPGEDTPGRDQVVVLSHGLWQRRFGADPGISGRVVTIDQRPFTVIGVLPSWFRLFRVQGRDVDLWMPLVLDRTRDDRKARSVGVYGRLRTGVSLDAAQAEMASIALRLEAAYPDANDGCGILLVDLQEGLGGRHRQLAFILLAAVGFVLLIACSNVASLLLARSNGRRREIAVRVSLGATRMRVSRQLLVETLLLAGLGAGGGLLLASAGVEILPLLIPGLQGFPNEIAIDWRVLGFTAALAVVTGLVFGLAPVLDLCLSGERSTLGEALKEGGRSASGGVRQRRVLRLLMLSEIALTVVLLIEAGLLMKSFVGLLSIDRGFRSAGLLTVQCMLARSKYSRPEQVAAFYRETLRRIEALPGVESAAAVNFVPVDQGMAADAKLTIEGDAPPQPGKEPSAFYYVATPGYFRTMGISLLSGRDFDERDARESTGVAIVNETMARQFWPDQDALGKRLRADFPSGDAPWRPEAKQEWLTIVGVAHDVSHRGLDEPRPHLFLPYQQSPSLLMYFVVRSVTSPLGPGGELQPSQLASLLRREVGIVDGDLPLSSVRTMEEVVADSFSQERSSMLLLGGFAILALFLAAVGIYAVVAHAVAQRRHEIGIRMALGAKRGDVLRLVLGQSLCTGGVGVLLGLAAALGLSRVVASVLHGVSPADPTTFLAAAVVALGVNLLASLLPAWRASRAEPLQALHEY